MKYVYQIKIPQDALDDESMNSILDWLLDSTIILYLASNKTNDFFLLHGVTSTWCLKQILLKAFIGEKSKMLEIIRLHVGVLIATYITQQAPYVCKEKLGTGMEEMKHVSWPEIKSKLLDEMPKDSDDHVYKLVQVCYETSRKFEHNSSMELVYKKAAMTVMLNPFVFI